MIDTLKNLIIVTGHYGSGKTELSLNLAMHYKSLGNEVTIVDMDVVNPYFRTNDIKTQLEEAGIKVIAPIYAGTNVDLPSIPAQMYSAFLQESGYVIIDAGGDPDGATVLGRFNPYIKDKAYDLLVVANTKRPLTADADELVKMVGDIESVTRLKVTGLINNTNLSYITTAEDVMEGQKIIENAATQLNLPIKLVVCEKEIASRLPEELSQKVFSINIYLKKY